VAELVGEAVLEFDGGQVRPLVRIEPFKDALVVSDRVPAGRPLPPEHVVAPAGGTRLLAALPARRRVAKALDMCCGSGAQALLLARQADEVVAVDVNPRSLRLAEAGLILNGVENVELRCGDLFEPVDGERFDLVVANPPYVLSPAVQLAFRDSGHSRDELSRKIVQGAAAHLAPRGFAHVLCSWIVAAGEHWTEAPKRWLDSLECNAIVLRVDQQDVVSYAVQWNAAFAESPEQAKSDAAEWLEHYRSEGIEEIATGAIVLHAGELPRWVHVDELVDVRGEAGLHIDRIVAGNELLARRAELMELPLVLADGVRVVRRVAAGGSVERTRLTVDEGLVLPGRVPDELAGILLGLDGTRTLEDLGRERGVTVDPHVPALRDVVARGYAVVTARGR
jgi:methylase of polypeptide subunit release factors